MQDEKELKVRGTGGTKAKGKGIQFGNILTFLLGASYSHLGLPASRFSLNRSEKSMKSEWGNEIISIERQSQI